MRGSLLFTGCVHIIIISHLFLGSRDSKVLPLGGLYILHILESTGKGQSILVDMVLSLCFGVIKLATLTVKMPVRSLT